MQYDIIEKAGAWFTIVDTNTGEVIVDKIQGQNKLSKYLDDNPEIMARVEELVNNAMGLDE